MTDEKESTLKPMEKVHTMTSLATDLRIQLEIALCIPLNSSIGMQ